jgi:hypothetical protein
MSSSDAEAKLQNLERRLKAGWEKVHAITESQRETVRNAVRQQWAERQKQAAAKKNQAATKQHGKNASQKQDSTHRRGQQHDEGHSH